MQLQFNDSEYSGSINVMNTWHPGNQSDILCQILKFKISMKQSTTAYIWHEKKNYIPGTSSNNLKANRDKNDATLFIQAFRATQQGLLR